MKLRSSRRSYLPEDLMIDIIRRLSVEDLLRFRSVNKSWYRFISSTSFIKSTISNTNINHDSYLLCTYSDYYTLSNFSQGDEDDFTDNINKPKYYYITQLFGIDKPESPHLYTRRHELKVYGICKGLLCVSASELDVTSSIYLWNPVIRKVKKISMIRPARGETRAADLCFGYFQDDYKVVRIAPFRGGKYRVGVYSLSTDTWKVIYCDSDCGTYSETYTHSSNKFVGGVAFFGIAIYKKGRGKLLGFDLNHKRILNIQFPNADEFGYNNFCSFAVEPRGESIALIRNIRGHLIKWVLRNCAVTDMFIWEKVVTLKLETPHIFPLGFTKHGKYLLRIDYNLDDKYLWDFGTSPLEVCTFDTGIKDRFAMAIDSLFGNLVLLDEKTLDPFVETEPCSTQHTCVLYRYPYKLPSPRNKKSTNLLVTTQYRMHGRGTQTAMEKPRKRGGKEMLNNKRNQLRERGTKRRKQGTEMEKPRKKKRKETFDRTKNVLQGRRKRRRMEETEMGNQRKKGRKEMMYKAQTILQGWGAKRRRDQTQNKLQGKRTTMNI